MLMRKLIITNEKELSQLFVTYLRIVLHSMRMTAIFFKWFRLPGLSRVLFIYSFFRSKGALRTIKFDDNGSFTFPVFDYYYNMFFLSARDYEQEILDLCNKVNGKFTFFDGGANFGYISSSFVHLSKHCTSLIAIEPNILLKQVLDLNISNAIQSSKRESFEYKIITKAISDESRIQQFFKIGRHAGSSLDSNGSTLINGVYLDTISLNDLVENYTSNEICLFKLDLEGSEFDALRSFKYFNRSIITIEILDYQNQKQHISILCKEKNLYAFIFFDKWINLTTSNNIDHLVKRKISNVGLNLLLVPKTLKDKVNV